MAKSRTKTHNQETKSKKRKVSFIEQENDEDSTVYDAEVEKETTPASPAHAPKRARQSTGDLDTSKPSAIFKPKRGRQWTLSIALPGSFIANTKAIDQKNELAGRIARAAAVFCVDEVIIFDDAPDKIPPQLAHMQGKGKNAKSKAQILSELAEDQEPWDNPDQFLYHILTYLETPGHLRRVLFQGHHPNLKGVGKLPTLDMPHHMRQDEWLQYREGAAFAPPERNRRKSGGAEPEETLIDCGFKYPVKVPCAIPAGSRVTLKFADAEAPKGWPHLTEVQTAELEVEPTSPTAPREEAGYYWGFSVRKADSLSAVYQEAPFADGYDCTIGTSERGVPLSSIMPGAPSLPEKSESTGEFDKLPDKFNHLLLVFGGVTGLETAVASDPILSKKGLRKENAHEAFDLWVNLVPGQGSRTIRTEEAVWLGLMGTREYVNSMS
ncbi:DUF171-domain-containing protein [Westerdykella ornata]|uniref:DUF171-domain-containing protein n=1 Tax=Westerdykella ornata TaxID=318751 RepID=A0A6A6JEB5_WESOR|nr:DUF171-domain-containing protein [Westerdykella ornata]KAF2274901.1 DUF171-domain-containing protein [Westerdykella ornata]